MRVFLIGFMGSGKTTIGKKLAAKLHLKFLDLDHTIEQEEKRSINTIFKEQGENYFRKMEHNTLKKLITQNDIIISCGGGTPCYYNNMELMNQKGITLYIELSAMALYSRLKEQKAKRPLLENIPNDKLLLFIEQKLQERVSFYDQSLIKTSALSMNVNHIAEYLESLK